MVLGQGNADSGKFDYTKQVQYPFGYGLSYTDFSYSDYSLTENPESFTVSVTVHNDGAVSGKNVVEVYMQSPYTDYDRKNLVEKSAVELCGFAKTGEIAPGESETVSIDIPKETLRAYDYVSAKTYIVDDGTYYFAVGSDCHTALNNILAAKGYTVADGMDAEGDASLVGNYEQMEFDNTTYAKDLTTGTEITNRFDNGSFTYYVPEYVYLSRNDWEGTWPQKVGEANKRGIYQFEAPEALVADSQTDPYHEDPDAVMPTTGSGQNINLITMRGNDYYLRFRDRIHIGDVSVQEFRYDKERDIFVSVDNDNYYICGDDPTRFFSENIYNIFQGTDKLGWRFYYEGEMSDSWKAEMDAINADFQAQKNPMTLVSMAFKKENNDLGLALITTYKTKSGNSNVTTYYDVNSQADGVTLTFNGNISRNGDRVLDMVPALKTFVTSTINQKFIAKKDDTGFNLNTLHLCIAGNEDKWVKVNHYDPNDKK